jgi:hypothetical protein
MQTLAVVLGALGLAFGAWGLYQIAHPYGAGVNISTPGERFGMLVPDTLNADLGDLLQRTQVGAVCARWQDLNKGSGCVDHKNHPLSTACPKYNMGLGRGTLNRIAALNRNSVNR